MIRKKSRLLQVALGVVLGISLMFGSYREDGGICGR